MKKVAHLALALMLTLGISGCSNKVQTYTGSVEGRNGEVTVEVALSGKKIEKVEVVKHQETTGIADAAIEKIPSAIVENQSITVDIVSGATITSNAIISGVEAALVSAGLNVSEYKKSVDDTEKAEMIDADVVIVGAGGSGLVASIVAADAGKSVVVVEKKSISGGNSTLATGGMNAAKTPLQDANEFKEGDGVAARIKTAKEKYPELIELTETVEKQYNDYLVKPEGYFDSVELFVLDTLVGGKNLNDRALVETLAGNSADAIQWLKSIGADLSQVGSFGGASVKRIHKPVNSEGKTIAVGTYLVPILEKTATDKGVRIIYDSPVSEIMMKDGIVTGVKAEDCTVNAKSVIIATGGFAGNAEMVESFKPELKGFASTNSSGVTGDGIKMAEAVGAATLDMDQIQIHPTVEFESKALITEGLRGDGAILVNSDGKRFTDEVGTRDAVSAAEISQPGGYAWLIVDQAMVDKSSVIAGYIKAGYTKTGHNLENLASEIAVESSALKITLDTWNECVKNSSDPEFGRTSFTNPLDTAPYYAIKVSPGVHHTMGGIKINSAAEVIDTNGNVIPGLFAAGEVTGGVHGANRLGGNAVADFVVFGRIAGESASEFSK